MKILIQNGRITGTANDEYAGPDEYIDAPADFDADRMADYVVTGGQIALPSQAPESVTRAQGKAALITAGLWSGVLAFVAEIPDPIERALAEVALNDTQQWHRSSPFFSTAAAALGLTGEQLDALFLAASKIEL